MRPQARLHAGEGPARILRWLPSIRQIRSYRREWLRHDLLAGLVLTALLVPQGLAYAELAGLPPVTGVYATMVPLLVYALLGPSRILILSPDSALAPLIAATVVPLAVAGDEQSRMALAAMLAVLVGAICIAAGIARLGFVTDLFAKPVRIGYLIGIALTVIVSQLPKLFGFSVDADDLLSGIREFVQGLDDTNGIALAIGIGSLALILACRRFAPVVPGVFLAVVGSTLAVWSLDLADEGVAVVGPLPEGLPSFDLPSVALEDMGRLLLAAAGIAFVAFTDTSVLSRTYAARFKEDVNQNQELVALGAANAAAGLFQGFPLSSSSSRTAVAETVGARTQLAGLVGAVLLALVLLFASGLVRYLPSSTLAAIVIAAVVVLIDVAGLRHLRRMRRSEFWLAIVAFLGVALLGVLWGIGIAIGLALLTFVRRAWSPHDAVLARAVGVKGYHDIERYPQARRVPGLLLYRFDAPLFFANAGAFRERVRRLVDESPEPIAWVVVCAEPITDVDTTAAETLEQLDGELEAVGVELAFAELKDHVRDRLLRYGLVERIGAARFFPTIGVAVRSYVEETGVEWVDWEEERPQVAAEP
jgi:high affinity sulfate transporter 1